MEAIVNLDTVNKEILLEFIVASEIPEAALKGTACNKKKNYANKRCHQLMEYKCSSQYLAVLEEATVYRL